MKVKIYGSRGSIAFSGISNTKYGGNSSCTVLDIDGHLVVLDCGTGLLQFYEENKECFKKGFAFDILLSHLHLDHIIGFSVFPPVFTQDRDIRIFTRSRNDQPLDRQVFEIFKPPYWPVDISDITGVKTIEIKDENPFKLNDRITVTPFFTERHNKTTLFRIDADKSVVYMLDYEMSENIDKYDKLIRFCENVDLVIFDASYLPDDYPPRHGWGHSTYEDGIALAKASGCKKMIFSHLSQDYTDDVLDTVNNVLDSEKFSIAYDGMVIDI